jgi:transposase
MEIVYVGLDLGSSAFQQVAMEVDGSVKVNRKFTTSEALVKVESRDLRTAIKQLYEVLGQSVAAQQQARLLMLRAAQAFPEIKLLRTVPGVGPIGACRFSAYIHTPNRFSSKRKLWQYCRLSVSHRSSNGKPLRRPRLDRRSKAGRPSMIVRPLLTPTL